MPMIPVDLTSPESILRTFGDFVFKWRTSGVMPSGLLDDPHKVDAIARSFASVVEERDALRRRVEKAEKERDVAEKCHDEQNGGKATMYHKQFVDELTRRLDDEMEAHAKEREQRVTYEFGLAVAVAQLREHAKRRLGRECVLRPHVENRLISDFKGLLETFDKQYPNGYDREDAK